MNNPLIKTCQYGHHWYSGSTCPICDYLGRENLEAAYNSVNGGTYVP